MTRLLWFVSGAGFGALVSLVAVFLLANDALGLGQAAQGQPSGSSDGLSEEVSGAPQRAPSPTLATISAASNEQESGTPAAPPPIESVASGDEIEELEQLVHQMVNVERERNGLRPLAYDQSLAAIARNHSEEMAEQHYLAHENLAGEGPAERGARQGYDCRKDYGSFFTEGISENIFQGWLYSAVTYQGLVPIKDWSPPEEIASTTVRGWMESPEHRDNILDSTYDREGIGVALSAFDRVYVTQNFC